VSLKIIAELLKNLPMHLQCFSKSDVAKSIFWPFWPKLHTFKVFPA